MTYRDQVIADGAVAQRFWRFVARTDIDSCWLWQGGTENGYGRFWVKGHVLAHRYAWIVTYGPIPDGGCVLHACDNPPCCNPHHLFLGTMADNNADMLRKGRQRTPLGEAHPNAKLTEDTVRIIRAEAASGAVHRALARRFSVNHSTIDRIVSRQWWQHV